MKFKGDGEVTKEIVQEYYITHKNRRNNLSMLRLLYPEFSKDIKFPHRIWKPMILPTKDQLKVFYDALPDKYKPIFTLLCECGLRVGELIGATFDKYNKMIIPHVHEGQTKHSWISFYRTEFNELPPFTVDGLNHIFAKTSKKCGVKVYPHLLRSVFAREASLNGMPSQYIDAFCGRVPQSVLARSYTDFSPETLKQVYNKYTNIPVLHEVRL